MNGNLGDGCDDRAEKRIVMRIWLTCVWRGLALASLVMVLAAPALPQDGAPEGQPPQNAEPHGQPPQNASPQQSPGQTPGYRGRPGIRMPGGPGRRPTPPLPTQPGQTPAATPPVPRPTPPTPGPKPGQPAASPSPTSPPSKLEASQTQGGQKMITMEFYGMDIDHLLRLLAINAHVTIIKSPDVQGVVTVICPEPVPLDVAFQILNSILAVRDYALVKAGPSLYKVVPAAIAIQTGDIPVRVGSRPEDVPSSSELITQVIPLKNLSATDVASQVAGLLSMNRSIIPTSTNCLIITDTAVNIRRVLDIVSYLESELSGGMKVFRLQHIDASTMADLAAGFVLGKGGVGAGGPRPAWERRVVGGPGPQGRGPGPQMQPQAAAPTTAGSEFAYPDPRTNSLIVQATPIHLAQIQDLVDQFDVAISLRDSYFLYAAQNVSASQLAKLLAAALNVKSTVVEEEGGGTGGAGATGAGGGIGTRGGQAGRGQFGRTGGAGGGTFQNRSLNKPAPVERTPQAKPSADQASPTVEVEPLAAPSSRARREPLVIAQAEGVMPVPAIPPMPSGEGGANVGEEAAYGPSGANVEATVTADAATNTLIITASPEQLEVIKQLLCQLDVRSPQVYIQAVIAEVGLTRENSLGFQWSGITGQLTRNNTVYGVVGGSNFGLTSPDTSKPPTGLSGVIIDAAGFEGIMNALTTDSHARILSTPGIFTASNKTGFITVSDSRPYPTGTVSTPTGTGEGVTNVVTTTVNYLPVGITLQVTPRVGPGDMVQMTVQVNADQPGDSVLIAGSLYPSTQQRQANAVLSIKDGYTVVLGGLMREIKTDSASKVPILGDIPVLGALFRDRKTHREKQELVVFLTPHVVRSPEEAQALSEKARDTLRSVPPSLQGPLAPTPAPASPADQ